MHFLPPIIGASGRLAYKSWRQDSYFSHRNVLCFTCDENERWKLAIFSNEITVVGITEFIEINLLSIDDLSIRLFRWNAQQEIAVADCTQTQWRDRYPSATNSEFIQRFCVSSPSTPDLFKAYKSTISSPCIQLISQWQMPDPLKCDVT